MALSGPISAEVGAASILLVDDRRENLISLRAVLEPLGERLVLAQSGDEALRCLLREDFALILMDAEMPGLSGFATAELIRTRERSSRVPIIFVTAHGSEKRNMFKSYSVGAVDYIPKPFDPDILRSKVKVFVELFRKNEQIQLQEKMIHENNLRLIEQRQRELQEAMEREHMQAIASELEARVLERTAELRAANEEMEAFCYSVSHDLRAPLRAISSTSKILLQDAGPRLNETERESLERQAGAAKRLGRVIDDLLSLSRLGREKPRREQVDLSALAESIKANLLARVWPAPIEIEVQEGLSTVADSGLVLILMDNLLENACKYSPAGGCVRVGCRDEFGVSTFFVKDQGIGFEMDYATKIFQPFERLVVDDVYEGTGIGLAIVSRIVNRHSGKVWAESCPGQGTTVYFTLGPPTYAA